MATEESAKKQKLIAHRAINTLKKILSANLMEAEVAVNALVQHKKPIN